MSLTMIATVFLLPLARNVAIDFVLANSIMVMTAKILGGAESNEI